MIVLLLIIIIFILCPPIFLGVLGLFVWVFGSISIWNIVFFVFILVGSLAIAIVKINNGDE